MLLEGAWVFAALLLVRPVVDWVVLRKVRNIDELLKGNKAVGAVEAGFYICAGFALNGSLDGQASSVLKSMESTVVFGVLGLLLVVGVFVFIHERITRFQLRKVLRDGGKRYNLQDEIAQGNLAAAYEVAGMLIGTSMVVREGVAGDFSGWRSGFAGFFATTLVAVIGLYLARWLIDRLVLTNCTVKEILEQNQINAGAVMMALVIVMALFLSTAIRLQL
ncbi:MAG TPA: DUF350 domain-containing protein [Candidatus Saccharimonadales bacterium]|nr:DUF350 domain-containing protein [Candidatus Saccharimonadales bacterium]